MFEWFFGGFASAAEQGIKFGSNTHSFFDSLDAFFKKIKDFLNIVLWGKLTYKVDNSGWLPKYDVKDTRFFMWQLLLICLVVFIVRLALGRFNPFSWFKK